MVSYRTTKLIFCLGALCSLAWAIPPEARTASIRVKAGAKIQPVIDAAPAGSKIIVEAGTYAEQLIITKNGIILEGQNAVLTSPTPDKLVDNLCTPITSNYTAPATIRQAGICVYGGGVQLDLPYTGEHTKVLNVTTFVSDVQISGFNISGFSGLAIALVGTKNARVAKNNLFVPQGGQYGALSLGSKDNVVTRNNVYSDALGFIGICMDDQSNVRVSVNNISGTFIGLCVQTDNADVSHNIVSNTCIGAFVDPGVKGAQVLHNRISNTNPICFIPDLQIFYLISGITIDGAQNTEVHNNLITGITDGNLTSLNTAAGIKIFNKPGDAATGNKVTYNTLSANDQDVFVDVGVEGNEVGHNK